MCFLAKLRRSACASTALGLRISLALNGGEATISCSTLSSLVTGIVVSLVTGASTEDDEALSSATASCFIVLCEISRVREVQFPIDILIIEKWEVPDLWNSGPRDYIHVFRMCSWGCHSWPRKE